MDFVNQTPFYAMCFEGIDLEDRAFKTILMKVAYRLQPSGTDPALFIPKLVLDDVPQLTMTDSFHGEVGKSSVREESDLAHYKPRCDVLVRGDAHAPHGRPSMQWNVRLKVSTSRAPRRTRVAPDWLSASLSPALAARYHEHWKISVASGHPSLREHSDSHHVVLDKILRITGEREYVRSGFGWQMTAPQATTRVPMRWERALGGSSVVVNPEFQQAEEQPEYLLNEVCFSNPLGCGWVEARYERALQKAGREPLRRLRAPQIEYLDNPSQQPVIIKHPQDVDPADPGGFIRIAQSYGQLPAGFGVVGRSWAPRLQLAGTYDERWKTTRWPYLPDDYDFGYWNCAPRDQQIDSPPPNMRVELWNLADPELATDGYIQVDLPDHQAFVVIHNRSGLSEPLDMAVDTVLIDTDAMMISLTYRIQIVKSDYLTKAEARFSTHAEINYARRKRAVEASEHAVEKST